MITISPDVASTIALPEGAMPGTPMQLTVTATMGDDGSLMLDSIEDVPLPDYQEVAQDVGAEEEMMAEDAAMADQAAADEAAAAADEEAAAAEEAGMYGNLPSRKDLLSMMGRR